MLATLLYIPHLYHDFGHALLGVLDEPEPFVLFRRRKNEKRKRQ